MNNLLRGTDDENSSDEEDSNIGVHYGLLSNINQPNLQQTGANLSGAGIVGVQTNTPNMVDNPKDLAIFGKYDPLNHSDLKFQMIEKYVKNSHGLSPGGEVKVHNIYEINPAVGPSPKKTMPSAAPNKKKFGSPKSTQGSENMLLWFKTTPAGIKHLAQGNDGCVAFYDRICRAFTEKPNNLQVPLHQIFFLCQVSLGKVCKDRYGFQTWSQVAQLPPGFDTVKGMGSLCPDWNENEYDDNVTIPCGPTVEHQVFRKYEINYNEYIVFDSKKIQVKYAVEAEIIPAQFMQNSSLGTEDDEELKISDEENEGAASSSGNASGSIATQVPFPPNTSNVAPPTKPRTKLPVMLPNNTSKVVPSTKPRTQLPSTVNPSFQPRPRFHQHQNPTRGPVPLNNLNKQHNIPRPIRAPNPNIPVFNPFQQQAPQPNSSYPHPNNLNAPMPVQCGHPGPSGIPQMPLHRGFNQSVNVGSSSPNIGQPPPMQQQQVQPTKSKKSGIIEPAALQILAQLPGASPTAFQKCLYKAQIITAADEIYDHIHTYVKNGSVHGYGLKVQSIIRIVRNNDVEFQHDPKMKGKKRLMLWHGTNDKVVAGILQTGFRIPTAKNQMFGTGIYFADRASKSANYCGNTKRGATAYLFLCDVAIGSCYNSKNAKNNFTSPPTVTTSSGATRYFDSLKCTGAKIPDKKENVDFYGCNIPLGKTITNTKYDNYTVQFNEFIVYNASQVKIKYLVKVQFT